MQILRQGNYGASRRRKILMPRCWRICPRRVPDLRANYRELMISGICGECFDRIFENDDDEDDSASDDEFFISKYDEKTDIFSDKYEGD